MKTTDHALHAIEPQAHWLIERIATFCRFLIELHVAFLKAWGHFFLMFIGFVLSVIAVTEFGSSQSLTTSLLQLTTGAFLMFSKKIREVIWVFTLLTIAWFIPLTTFSMILLGHSLEPLEPTLFLKGILALIYLGPPVYGTFLIFTRKKFGLNQSR